MDCVREASRRTPQTRTAFGAPLRQGVPVVTFVLIGMNVVSFLLEQVLGNRWTYSLALLPRDVETYPWTFLTSAFLHAGILHIAFNMYALWWLGQYLETALGRWRFVGAYLVSALGGSTMVVLLADPGGRSWVTYVLGASGAVFGLFGLVLVVLRRLGRDARAIVALLVINGVIGFVIPNVAWQAHLGGLLSGLALGLVFAYAPKGFRTGAAVIALVGLTALLVVLVGLKL
ncbi:MAG TPA: rhomboid family intramembrane serine protease, partial [Actinotalea sp.]|nr:rhomboid family intramembrane serine protease [Actinotalea sp.]